MSAEEARKEKWGYEIVYCSHCKKDVRVYGRIKDIKSSEQNASSATVIPSPSRE